MRRFRCWTLLIVIAGALLVGGLAPGWAQEEAPKPVDMEDAASGKADEEDDGGGFFTVVGASGGLGIALWLSLLATSLAGIYLIIDSFVKIRVKKIMPEGLVERVQESMANGDLGQAMEHCKDEPGPMANILMSGFANVEEGFDVIQDVVNAVADLESEKLLQKVTYLSVVSNLSPMLGLMGTVQGMIYAFGTLAKEAGAAQQAMLAMNLSQALYTTMAGLSIAVPAVAFYYYFRNQANNIILNMVITTVDLIKSLRNVEVVPG